MNNPVRKKKTHTGSQERLNQKQGQTVHLGLDRGEKPGLVSDSELD